jgi:hypothetical protein
VTGLDDAHDDLTVGAAGDLLGVPRRLVAVGLRGQLVDLADVGDAEVLVPLALSVEEDDEDALLLGLADVLVERRRVDPGEADGVRLGRDRLGLELDGGRRIGGGRTGELGLPADEGGEVFQPRLDRGEERVVVVVDEDDLALGALLRPRQQQLAGGWAGREGVAGETDPGRRAGPDRAAALEDIPTGESGPAMLVLRHLSHLRRLSRRSRTAGAGLQGRWVGP